MHSNQEHLSQSFKKLSFFKRRSISTIIPKIVHALPAFFNSEAPSINIMTVIVFTGVHNILKFFPKMSFLYFCI
jgi:hypothetical protein